MPPLEKQAKNLKNKLPQKAHEKLATLKNKTSALSQELRDKARTLPFLEGMGEKFSDYLETIKERSDPFIQEVSKNLSLDKISFNQCVYWGGIYNIVLAVCLGLPAGIVNIGVNIGDHALSKLVAAFLLFTAVIQIIGSRDLKLYGWAVYWEGILRVIAGLLLFAYGFFGHLGIVACILGLIDLFIGAAYLTQVPIVTKKNSRDLLAGK